MSDSSVRRQKGKVMQQRAMDGMLSVTVKLKAPAATPAVTPSKPAAASPSVQPAAAGGDCLPAGAIGSPAAVAASPRISPDGPAGDVAAPPRKKTRGGAAPQQASLGILADLFAHQSADRQSRIDAQLKLEMDRDRLRHEHELEMWRKKTQHEREMKQLELEEQRLRLQILKAQLSGGGSLALGKRRRSSTESSPTSSQNKKN